MGKELPKQGSPGPWIILGGRRFAALGSRIASVVRRFGLGLLSIWAVVVGEGWVFSAAAVGSSVGSVVGTAVDTESELSAG